MQLTITNGTLTQIQETLSPTSGYTLPTSITVTGATSNYDSSTGVITLTSLTDTMSITAEGEQEQEDNKITFGNLPISSIYCGNVKVTKISLGNIDIYSDEKPATAHNVTLTASGRWAEYWQGGLYVYDGTDDTAPILLSQHPADFSAFPMTLQATSGSLYIYFSANFIDKNVTSSDYSVTDQTIFSVKILGIDHDGAIDLYVDDWDD